MITIYTISHPTTNHIVYVGKTYCFEQRKYQHTHGYGNCKINEWERALLKQGLIPIVEILEETETFISFDIEMYWINQLISWGFTLLNSNWDIRRRTSFKRIA